MLRRSALQRRSRRRRSVAPSPTLDAARRSAQTTTSTSGSKIAFAARTTEIARRLRAYRAAVCRGDDVLDVGCGRGEFLAALKAAGISARGIDTNAEMVAVARERGLDATQADALGYLASLARRVARRAHRHAGGRASRARPTWCACSTPPLGSCAPARRSSLETINPACWLAFFSSYIRDFTHVRPVHPETLQYLLRASGFERVTSATARRCPST